MVGPFRMTPIEDHGLGVAWGTLLNNPYRGSWLPYRCRRGCRRGCRIDCRMTPIEDRGLGVTWGTLLNDPYRRSWLPSRCRRCPPAAGCAAGSAAGATPVQQNGFRLLWKPLLNNPYRGSWLPVALNTLEAILSLHCRGLWWVHFE